MAVFYPTAIKENDDFKFPSEVQKVNLVFDLNKDGVLTKREVRKMIYSRYDTDIKKEAIS